MVNANIKYYTFVKLFVVYIATKSLTKTVQCLRKSTISGSQLPYLTSHSWPKLSTPSPCVHTKGLQLLYLYQSPPKWIQWFWLRTLLIGAFVWVEGGRGHFPLPAVFRLPHNAGNSKHFYFTSCVRLYQISSSSSAGICRVIYLTISPNMQLAANHSYLFQEVLNLEKLLVAEQNLKIVDLIWITSSTNQANKVSGPMQKREKRKKDNEV